jgi:FkbM family methyltransferase
MGLQHFDIRVAIGDLPGAGEKESGVLSNRWFESLLGLYSRVAISERGSYRLARIARRLRPQDQWRDRYTTPDGLKLDLNFGVYPDICMACGLYELATVRLLKRILKPGDHFVDAGANIGYLSLYGARCVGPTGRVDAFEPEEGNRHRLEAHLLLNKLQDAVTVHPYALSDHKGSVTLYRWPEDDPKHNHGCTSLFSDHSESAQMINAECRTLDEVLDGEIPQLIKMDVEGAEPMLVEGMMQTILAPRPPILIGELNPAQSRIAGFAPHEWICRVVDIQPKYKVYTIGSRVRRRKLDELAGLSQMNLMLKV